MCATLPPGPYEGEQLVVADQVDAIVVGGGQAMRLFIIGAAVLCFLVAITLALGDFPFETNLPTETVRSATTLGGSLTIIGLALNLWKPKG